MARVKTSQGSAAPPVSLADGVRHVREGREALQGVDGKPGPGYVPHPFPARAGDVLVVSYPEVAVPIAPYFTVRVGGLTYSRQLFAGDDAAEQYESVYAFLRDRAERDAAAKIAAWAAEQAESQARRK